MAKSEIKIAVLAMMGFGLIMITTQARAAKPQSSKQQQVAPCAVGPGCQTQLQSPGQHQQSSQGFHNFSQPQQQTKSGGPSKLQQAYPCAVGNGCYQQSLSGQKSGNKQTPQQKQQFQSVRQGNNFGHQALSPSQGQSRMLHNSQNPACNPQALPNGITQCG